ncbi:MAG: glycosyltransferase family 39 protein [Deltaproteobacteria bacterium]|nr:glycosyltransferase family 39 protein [Deltaproteobacteria bacterium]
MSGLRIALALALVQAVLLLGIARDKSDTVDESSYMASAATLWAHRDFQYLCGAPVLPMWGFALALRTVDPALAATPRAAPLDEIVGGSAAAFRRRLLAARGATVAVVVAAGLALGCAARRFGPRAGLAAQALWCFSPTVLANGALATLDAWSAALACAVLLATIRLLERPTAACAAALGVTLAGAAATKITTLPMIFVLGAVAVTRGMMSSDRRSPARVLVGACAAAFFVTLWVIYGLTVGAVQLGAPCTPAAAGVPSIGPLPFPAWIEGAAFQVLHGREGHLDYLFGAVSRSGWWWFYLTCLGLKLTLGAQAIAVLRGSTLLGASRHELALDLALLAYPVLLLVLLSAGRHQANVAFLLPAFPFAMVWAARALGDAPLLLGARGRAVFAALLLLAIGEALRVYPHELMFFNVWAGGPEGGPRYLVHREDWGQDKRRLGKWQRRHGVDRLFYAGYGSNAELWGVVGDPVPCTPTVGTYALHAVEVHRPQFSLTRGCVDWLTVEPPDERLGYSIYIYRVDAARLERLRRERATTRPFWRSGSDPPAPTAAVEWRSPVA